MLKSRCFPESNYRAFFFNNKTIRVAIDSSKPITELQYPEFYDIGLGTYCEGNCSYCSSNASKEGKHAENTVEKIKTYFGSMNENQRPFQVALGFSEPTLHPEFTEILETFHELGIIPNYTSNGMWIDRTYDPEFKDNILKATRDFCGGVALSCHPHLSQYWKEATLLYSSFAKKAILNYHIIISDKESIDYFLEIYNMYEKDISYFVLLPYISKGRAVKKDIDWEYLIQHLPQNTEKIAFSAGFYPYLLQGGHNIKVSLYEPEIMSKFLDLRDMKLYNSSFDVNT